MSNNTTYTDNTASNMTSFLHYVYGNTVPSAQSLSDRIKQALQNHTELVLSPEDTEILALSEKLVKMQLLDEPFKPKPQPFKPQPQDETSERVKNAK